MRSLSNLATPNALKLGSVSHQRPEIFTLDGITLTPDEHWNLSPNVLGLLERRLLDEPHNPLTLMKRRIIEYMQSQHRTSGVRSPSFAVCDQEPRVVSVWDNFDSLLTPPDHVSRRPTDTYYINEGHCLRAHTSAHQHRLIKQGFNQFVVVGDVYRRDEINRTHYPSFHQIEGVQLYTAQQLFGHRPGQERLGFNQFVVVGDVYRRDEINRTHYPSFHQIEGVQLYTAQQLFGHRPGQEVAMFENGERNVQKQETHTIDAANVISFKLKGILEGLARYVFGDNIRMRWVDAYFPFTHPSYELEIFYENNWMEVLGCGVIEQKLLELAGVSGKAGWAFGLGLERLAMVHYGIPDIRLFWSRDSGFLSQFADRSPSDSFKYRPVSVHPQLYFDLSFWLPEDAVPEEITANTYDLIRSVSGSLIEQVNLTDSFRNKKTGRLSQTYRLVYRSSERALTKNEVNVIHKEIEKQVAEKYGVKLR
ncbi:Phenylalanine--tRNA ligase, mitochondrial [Toxocara canis]|uniref:phenylalanine--tRNA ligase n=1 Tax=Toxocara canis TaxID=6265 RepID=A0A0B2W0S9_TOXCA|nr:Phenylalanine--tRNA ligase, mitochondrial [Toxocara canis]